MRIGIVGAGHIGGNAARLLAAAGHDVVVSFSRDEAALAKLAADIGARAGTPAEAAAHGDVVVLWCRGGSSTSRSLRQAR